MSDLLGGFRGGTPSYRQSPFGYTGNDPAQLFADLGQGINPAGFVSNVDNLPANVIINENGITVTDGAITVTNAGATVIIDGTSDMFKIAATGTLTKSQGAHTTGTATVSLSSLSFASTPAIIGHVANSSSGTADANPVYFGTYVDSWVAASIGGTTNLEGATTGVHAWIYDAMSGTTPVPTLINSNAGNASTLQVWGRYYVLQEAAL